MSTNTFRISYQYKAGIDRGALAGKTFGYSKTGEFKARLPLGKKVTIASPRAHHVQGLAD